MNRRHINTFNNEKEIKEIQKLAITKNKYLIIN